MTTEVPKPLDMRELPREFESPGLVGVDHIGRYAVIKEAPIVRGSSGFVLFATTSSEYPVAIKVGHSSATEAFGFYHREVTMLEKAVRVTSVPEVDDVGTMPLMVSVGENRSKKVEERRFPYF